MIICLNTSESKTKRMKGFKQRRMEFGSLDFVSTLALAKTTALHCWWVLCQALFSSLASYIGVITRY